jgi:DNA-binding NarL/FixJ family response regulator
MDLTITVVIADDHQFLRQGFRTALSKKRFGLNILGEAENGEELVHLCLEHKPDIVFTDIQMPKMDGISACRAIKSRLPSTGVIALSMFDEEACILDMLKAGANGYLLKNTSPVEVSKAARAVFMGGTYYSREISGKVDSLLSSMKGSPAGKENRNQLSAREIDIIKLTCEEYSNKEIADKLGLSPRTVEGYKERIHLKTGTTKLAGLVIYAVRKGLFAIK